MNSFKNFETPLQDQENQLQEGASWRKRWGSGGVKINTSASSRGFNASLSIGNTNKKGLGWTYNTNNGLTLSLRGTGLRWTPSKSGGRSSGTSAEDKERARIERGIEVYSDKIDPYISRIMDALGESVNTILGNVKDATDQVNTLLKNNQLPDQEDFDELLKIYSNPYSFLLSVIHETDRGGDLKEINLTISGRNKIDGDVLHALDKKYADEFKKTQYAKHASIECFKLEAKNAVFVEIKGLLESAVKIISEDMKSNFSEAASGFLANYYGLKLNIELEKNADDIAGLKLAVSQLKKSYNLDMHKVPSSKANTLLTVKLDAASSGETDMDGAVKRAQSKASDEVAALKKSSKNNFMMGAAVAAGAGALAVGSVGTIPVALASLYSLYHLGVAASKSGKAKQMKKDYELKEAALNINDIIKALKNVYSDVESIDSNKKKQIESMLSKTSSSNLSLISKANIKHVSDIAKKLLQTKLKEETMLEKIRRIKASMNESSSDALCSNCQVAPCECHRGNHVEEGTGSLKPGWMLKADPKLAAKVKANKDLHKKRAASYGNPAAGKSVKEDAEQIDELSNQALRSYKHKAELSIPKDDKEYANRSKGIDRADKKLKKESAHPFDEFSPEQLEDFMQTEDYQQLDELSKKTLGSYIDKVATGPSRGSTPNGKLKSIKAIGGVSKAIRKQYSGSNVKEAAQYPRAGHTDVKDVAAPRAPAEQQHATMHKVTVKNGIPAKHEDGADKVKGAAKAQPAPKKNYTEDPLLNKDIYIQSFKSYVTMKGDLERM